MFVLPFSLFVLAQNEYLHAKATFSFSRAMLFRFSAFVLYWIIHNGYGHLVRRGDAYPCPPLSRASKGGSPTATLLRSKDEKIENDKRLFVC